MKWTIITILLGGALLSLVIFSSRQNPGGNEPQGGNVSIVDGKQIVEINTKGGYFPRLTVAEAGLPTVIRFNTKGTFDCSLALRIPSLNVSKILPQSGSTDIDAGTPGPGTLQGTCSMGMYSFQINFESKS